MCVSVCVCVWNWQNQVISLFPGCNAKLTAYWKNTVNTQSINLLIKLNYSFQLLHWLLIELTRLLLLCSSCLPVRGEWQHMFYPAWRRKSKFPRSSCQGDGPSVTQRLELSHSKHSSATQKHFPPRSAVRFLFMQLSFSTEFLNEPKERKHFGHRDTCQSRSPSLH